MAATVRVKVYTGTTAATENPDAAPGTNAASLNFCSSDVYDSDGTYYLTYPLVVPTSGTNYSFERWFRIHFSGAFASITNIKVYKSAGNYSDSQIVINAAVTTTAVTPTEAPSTIATSAIPTSAATALVATPAAGLTDYSKYIVMQMKVPNSVVVPHDVGTQTLTISYDET